MNGAPLVNPFALEDEWAPALSAIFGQTIKDLKPLAAMLRGSRPIPPGVRDTLAELLDPGEPDIYGLRFDVVPNLTENKFAERFKRWLPVAIAYEAKRRNGLTSEVAAEEVGEEFGMSDRNVKRLVERWKRLSLRVRNKG